MIDKTDSSEVEVAVLGAGCFWCVEAIFAKLRGVQRVQSGYCGGKTKNPSYEEVKMGATAHAEVCEITFDAKVLPYSLLLDVFLQIHDPTTLNQQGADVGTQYRSVIFPQSALQKDLATAAINKWDEEGVYENKIVTTIEPQSQFYQAEDYHGDYFALNPEKTYCSLVIAPKVEKFTKKFTQLLK